MAGAGNSAIEVTQISRHGLWLLLNGEELFVPFAEFPFFRNATIEQIFDVEWPSADHLYWPRLDVDLSVASIRNPINFPFILMA